MRSKSAAKLLINRSFGCFWLGESVSVVGNWFNIIALRGLVWELTRSVKVVGLLGSAQALPVISVGLAAGVVADRYDRRKLMLVCNLSRLVVMLTLVFYHNIVWIFVVVVVNGVAAALFAPTKNSVVPMLVPVDRIRTANSWMQGSYTSAKVVGPALAGAILRCFTYPVLFLLNAVSFGFAALTLAVLPPLPPARVYMGQSPVRQLVEGMKWLTQQSSLVTVVAAIFAASLGAGAFNTVLVVYASSTFDLGASGYALFVASIGAGMIMGVVAAAWSAKTVPLSADTVIGSVAVTGFFAALSGLVHHIWLVIVMLWLMGIAYGLASVWGYSFIQQGTPKSVSGRVFGLITFLTESATLVAAPVAGFISSSAGVRWVIVGAGIFICMSGLLAPVLVADCGSHRFSVASKRGE